jgi:hypothetical protein
LIEDDFQFPNGAIAISSLTQQWGHVSTWDKHLLIDILAEIGFVNVSQVDFQQGSDKSLLRDYQGRKWESLYVEAQKPPST